MPSRRTCRLAAGLLAAFAVASPALAQSGPVEGPWRYAGTLYLWVPGVSGKTRFPADSGGTEIEFDVLEHLKFTLMGGLEAHNGRWGFFGDGIYIHLGTDKNNTRDFTIGGSLPATTSADLKWDLTGGAITLGGQYRLVADPKVTLDALGGVRWLKIDNKFKWDITGDVGSLDPAAASGSRKSNLSNFDAVVGVRGRIALGDAGGPWSAPYYLDVGTGESKLTWQVAGGVRYAFGWGELSGLWRYVRYDMKSSETIERLSFNGPMVGATWRW